MGRREKPLNNNGPLAEFAGDLRRLRGEAGNPSYRHMASLAMYSPSVLSEAASGHRLPTLPVTQAFVRACGGDVSAWELRWRQVRGVYAVPDPPLTIPAPPAEPPPFPRGLRPAQVPVGCHDFIGRTTELAFATAAGRVPLIISGPAGIGKTAFAIHVARRLGAEFPEGQLWADMGSDDVQPLDVMAGFLLALGTPPDQVPDDAAHRVGLYRSTLAERRVIVVLDNVRDESRVRPLLARSATSQILITGRSRLLGLDGVRRVMLPPLQPPESVDLLRLLLGAERVRPERGPALRIAEFCAHLPLALTIAGRRIASQPGRLLGEFADRMETSVQVTDWLWIGDIHLADAVLPAYRALPLLAQRAVHILAAGTGEPELGALANALRVPLESAEYAIDVLIDAGLLHRVATPQRYVLPTLIGRLITQESSRPSLFRDPDTAELPMVRTHPATVPRG